MRNLLAIIFICGFLSPFTHGLVYQDSESDAIIIDDEVVYDPAEFDPSTDGNLTTPLPEGHCITAAGIYGKCVTKDVCFPYISYLVGNEETDYTTALQEILNSTESCPNSDVLICCPNYSYGLPNKKPITTLPTSSSTTSTTISSAPSTDSTTNEPIIDTKESCGSYARSEESEQLGIEKVVGGRTARVGEFPWAVALLNDGRQFCGGSLINPNYILTAAHCVQGLRSISSVSVLIGAHDLSQKGTRVESRTAAKVLYHKSFSMSHLNNDVALIKLSSAVAYTSLIQPVCLNSGAVPYDEKADLAGWGKTSNSGYPSSTLRTVKMRVLPQATCRAVYEGTQAPPLTDGMICAGEKANGLKDACNGDSGGPFTYAGSSGKAGRARQIGIVSWGIGCGEKPGVYTNVAKYLDWINRNSK